MSRIDFLVEEEEGVYAEGERDPSDDEDAGAFFWEDDDVEAAEGDFAQASLTALGAAETTRRGDDVGRGFSEMKTYIARADLEEPQDPHTLIAVRDSGMKALAPHEIASMDPETARGQDMTKRVVAQHYLMAQVSEEFLRGETDDREAVIATLDPETGLASSKVMAHILPPRVPQEDLPAGALAEAPIIRLITSSGALVKQTTVRRTYQNPKDEFQKIWVVDDVLAKWAKPKKASGWTSKAAVKK